MVFVFGYPAGESEEPIFSGRVAGTVSDTLQFPIREIRDKTPPDRRKVLLQPPFYGNLAGSAESPFENVVVRIQPEADSGRE